MLLHVILCFVNSNVKDKYKNDINGGNHVYTTSPAPLRNYDQLQRKKIEKEL